MKSYSFLKEVNNSFSYGDDDNPRNINYSKRIRRNWHTPQSRANARLGSVGSFSSITSKYNNVYRQEEPSLYD